MSSKNAKTLAAFTKYCQAHPELRFYQALAACFGHPYIGEAGGPDGAFFRDLFFNEGLDGEPEKYENN